MNRLLRGVITGSLVGAVAGTALMARRRQRVNKFFNNRYKRGDKNIASQIIGLGSALLGRRLLR